MKAVLCKEFGGPETLVVDDIPTPTPGEGEVRLRIHACGVNFGDTLIIRGTYQVKPELPFSPGMECAGEISEVGPGVKHHKVGDRVLAMTGHGGFAQEVIVNAKLLIPIPDSMPFVDAAAFPVAYGTSHVGLDYRAGLKAGETLLVLGAAGGVGLTAVEIGKAMGATVIAAASSAEKLEVCKQYGADHVINYSEEDIRERVKEITGGKGADVIYDPVGGDAFDAAMRSIAWEGRLVVIGFASGRVPEAKANILLVKNISVVGFYWGSYNIKKPEVVMDSMKTLLQWYDAAKIKPHVSHQIPMEKAADALEMMIQRKSTGKVVLTLD
ncbi:MAG: NADPH:quinone oxidoreductase family protein [Alphaproteobacteria bacterium]|nr:NADPH:quinone oxidoreductase family protein [Alphaproteobacteria bacterium]MBT6385745.1 NADPH:quinone oxidoreductase family protein [Alphaproteobacteria bacterium]